MNAIKIVLLVQVTISILYLLMMDAFHVYAQKPSDETSSPALISRQPISPNVPFSMEKGVNEYGVWGGGSFHSPTLIGTTEDSKLITAGLRYGRVSVISKQIAIEYTADAVPLTVISLPCFVVQSTGHGPLDFVVEKNRKYIYGGESHSPDSSSTFGGEVVYSRLLVPAADSSFLVSWFR